MNNIKNLKDKADVLFWIFEKQYFRNTGNYPRQTNLVLEFAEFIQNSSKSDLEQYVHFRNDEEYLALKQIINQGIDLWLDPGTLKTLLL